MFEDFFLEFDGTKVLKFEDKGFLAFEEKSGHYFISMCYVKPEFRHQKIGSKMVDELRSMAKEKGFHYIVSTLDLRSKTFHESLMAQLKYGFRIFQTEPNLLYLEVSVGQKD